MTEPKYINVNKIYFAQRFARVDQESFDMVPVRAVDKEVIDSSMNYYEYEIRKCGNDWQYCDGKCYQCAFTLTTTTAGSIEFQCSDTNYSNKTSNGGGYH